MSVHRPLPVAASDDARRDHHAAVRASIDALLEGEQDWVAAMATVSCALHHAFAYFHWTGFYRVTNPEELRVGPYQGTHGCLWIPFDKGICGAAARSHEAQRVDDVTKVQDHIACSASTRSELVVPVLSRGGALLAVLDVDSDVPAAFGSADQKALESLCEMLGERFAGSPFR